MVILCLDAYDYIGIIGGNGDFLNRLQIHFRMLAGSIMHDGVTTDMILWLVLSVNYST